MIPSRKPSLLVTHRPKTSSAADEKSVASGGFESLIMKRTASQTFSPTLDALADRHDANMPLGSLKEGASVEEYPASQHQHSGSLSRIPTSLKSSCKQICRRLSASSTSRRPSLASIADNWTGNSSASESSTEQLLPPRLQLHHKDSGIPTPFETITPGTLHSRFSALKRLGSVRNRRPATSGPSGDFAKFNPSPAPYLGHYSASPNPLPGSAARAAAAAANNERLNVQRQEQEQVTAFLSGGGDLGHPVDEVLQDSESGVGMEVSTPITRADGAENKLDPICFLPGEINDMIFSNLDAASLSCCIAVSRLWKQRASSDHVWKPVFLRRFEPPVHVSPAPIQMGGLGIGKFQKDKHAPGQQWQAMYHARKTIERRWKACSPSAIYLNGHTDSVYCCQFDEDKLITGSRDRTIRVWDMKTYRCVKVIGGPSHVPAPNTPPVLPVHKEMVVSHISANGTEEGAAIYHVPVDYHDASILCLQYDKTIMVTGSSDHTCIVWDITGAEYVPIKRLTGHNAGVLDVAIDDNYIISCSKDAKINIWNRRTLELERTLEGHRGPVNAVQLRGDFLVSASGDGVAKLWTVKDGCWVKDFRSQDRGLAAVEFSDDQNYILAGGNDHVVYKYDCNSGALLQTSVKHGALVRSLFLDAHNNRVVSGSYDQSIRIADYQSGEVFGLYENWTTSWILSAKSDYRRVVATSQDGRALILDFGWNVENKETLVGNK